ncbi:MAG: hypothetical protein CR982_02565 [Candidatus Cloacimonadota bacterium]|nr:MAG: hypothetical protein CR982_02565 [Candidatus Cloacimonadota bacterium]PIE79313.1 MAG: hypothetical protein CSA15_03420 [Candidatus Delongbacteria bacterium]
MKFCLVLVIAIYLPLAGRVYSFNDIKEIAKNSYEYKKAFIDSLNFEIIENSLTYYYTPKVDLKISGTPYSENIIYGDNKTSSVSNIFSSTVSIREKIPFELNLGANYGLNYSNSPNSETGKNSFFSLDLSREFYPLMIQDIEYKLREFDRDEAYLRKKLSFINYQFRLLDNYYNYFKAQEELKLNQKSFEQSKENFETGNRKYIVGLIPEVDKLEMELRFEENKISFEKGLDRFKKQKTIFFDFIGFEGDSLVVSEELEIIPPKFNFEEDLKKALSMNQELLSKKREKLTAKKSKSDFFKENLLSSSIGGSYSLRSENYNLFSEDRVEDINLSLSLNIPIFNNFNFFTKYDKVKLEERLTNEDYMKSIEKAKVDFKDMIKALEFSYRKLLISVKSNQLAERIYEISKKRYEEGQITSKIFIDHQQSLERKNLDLLSAKISYTMQLNSYRKLLGEFLF